MNLARQPSGEEALALGVVNKVADQLKQTTLSPDQMPGKRIELCRDTPLLLDCGVRFGPITVAYQTYGRLNADRSNAILICHALHRRSGYTSG